MPGGHQLVGWEARKLASEKAVKMESWAAI
jgi:hypothetical protein